MLAIASALSPPARFTITDAAIITDAAAVLFGAAR
jgi:hypothetical protein